MRQNCIQYLIWKLLLVVKKSLVSNDITTISNSVMMLWKVFIWIHTEAYNRFILDLQWLPFENRQSPVYVVNKQFLRKPDRQWKCCHNLGLFAQIYPILELSNEVLYHSILQGLSKILQVKAEKSKFPWLKLNLWLGVFLIILEL